MGKLNRFLDFGSRKLVRSWIRLEAPREIPWAPLGRPLAECRVALVSTAGLALAEDIPFDQDGERRDPWWGDPSFRMIPREAVAGEVRAYHLHVNLRPLEQDLDCVFPLGRLRELAEAGTIGSSAPTHYSFMGYTLRPAPLLSQSVPAMVRRMRAEGVDLVLLAPF
jgi:D-proline reductase (dithiol) PrdB